MALCDYLISSDIQGYDCERPMIKGAQAIGRLINRADINFATTDASMDGQPFQVRFTNEYALKCGKKGYAVYQSGKQPFNGTQQVMVEGVYRNTITNTLQLVVLRQDADFAKQLFALINGEFVAVMLNKNGTYQVYGYETGLHCTGAVRELYNDDTLSGWLITFTEEGAAKGNIFTDQTSFLDLLAEGACE